MTWYWWLLIGLVVGFGVGYFICAAAMTDAIVRKIWG